MTNWVSNSIRIRGSKEELQRFAQQAGGSHKRMYHDLTADGLAWVEGERDEHLSFWNFIKPDDSILDQYWGEEPRKSSLQEYLRHDSNHWYDWNVRNWGVKWDASSVYFEDWGGELAYDFETPWEFPEPVIRVMVEQYPTLEFTVRFLEEQGWGGKAYGANGEFSITDEWEIPVTHEERMEYIGYCHCEENDELDYMYDDCPKKLEAVNA